MIPRRLSHDFSDVSLGWAPNKEFATSMNAVSPIASQLEPYLNKVMAIIRKRLGPDQARLGEEIDLFIAQESNHFRLHNVYNKRLFDRYPALKDIEAKLKDDYKSFLADRSLTFNAAYSSGFENIALFMAKFYFDQGNDLFDGADPKVVDLFLWHNAEEYEHRSVCHAAFAAVSGNYFWRIYGAFTAFAHLAAYKKRFEDAVFEQDRAAMSKAERAASVKRQRALARRTMLYTVPRMLRILLPYYCPAEVGAPERLLRALDHYAESTAA